MGKTPQRYPSSARAGLNSSDHPMRSWLGHWSGRPNVTPNIPPVLQVAAHKWTPPVHPGFDPDPTGGPSTPSGARGKLMG
ncbi:hypothetical protein GCM10025789_00540 [Tessaracoccus lubricantis]|uniref:Uncharacterized protein n=1 Tax=Tessaracoccus lubricantis TaxID=545543 RepID=A0ABP9F4P2_9ACTN